MIIKKLTASFGTLQNDELRLTEGLNIVEAPNETGKSTWCAFIRAMLYGIDTADRDKAGYLSAKTRYRPWNGQPMEGKMEVVFGGRSLTLQRRAQGNYPMRDFSAFYTGTSEALPQFTDKTAGETLTGVSEPIFERSAFIRQSGLAVSQTAELEKRIAALVSTGEESVSYSEVDSLLREWLRRRKHNQRGLLPAVEGEARQVREKLEMIERANEKLSELRLEKERMENYRDDFLRESDNLDRFEKRNAREAYYSAAAELEAAQKTLDEALSELTQSGDKPTREDIAEIRGDLERLAACDAVYAAASGRRDQMKKTLDSLGEAKGTYSFHPMSADEADERANRAAAEYVESGEPKSGTKAFYAKASAALVAAVVLALVGALTPLGYPGYIAAGLMALVFVALVIRYTSERRNAAVNAEKRAAILNQYGISSVSELLSLVREYKELCYKEEAAASAFASADEEMSEAEGRLGEVKSALISKLQRLDPAASDVARAPALVARTEKLLDTLDISETKRDAAKKLADTLSLGVDKGEPEVPGDIQEPKYSRAEITASLKYAEKQLMAINGSLSMALGELKSLGDPVVLRTRAAELDERLKELNTQYDAIALAIDTLSEANTDIQSRFAPLLSARSGEILAELTGGRYEGVSFDKKLSAEAERAGDSASRNILYLSEGTADQLYLSLRLAVCELVLPDADPCPIILDDALTNFDDTRMKLALDFLKKTGENRQVILFTCHGREAGYFYGVRDVNIVKGERIPESSPPTVLYQDMQTAGKAGSFDSVLFCESIKLEGETALFTSCIVLMQKALGNRVVNSLDSYLVGLSGGRLVALRHSRVKLFKAGPELRSVGLVPRVLNLGQQYTLLR